MGPFLRKYNVTLDLTTAGSLRVRVPIRKAGSADFAVSADWVPAAGDVKVSKDGGAQANIGTLPTFSNGSWEFTLSATELSAKLNEVRIADSATKAVDDEGFNVETFGNASAMYPADYIDGVRNGLTALPNVAAGANLGLPLGNASGHVTLADSSLVTAKLGTFALAKTTNITGFNDIAATAIVSAGAINTASGAVSTVTTLTNLPAITPGWLTAAGIAADAITDAKVAADVTIASVTGAVGSVAGHTPQTGDSFARLGAPAGASVSADVAAVQAKTVNLPVSPAAVGSAMTLTTGERDSIATALLDLAAGVEASVSVRQALRLIAAAVGGELSGAATATVTIKAAANSGTTRVSATTDASGNRTALTLSL